MFKVDLSFSTGEVLSYTSLPYEFAEQYIEEFIYPLCKPDREVKNNILLEHSHHNFPTYENREEIENLLIKNITTLQKNGYDLPYNGEELFNRDTLNTLHEYFHTEVENTLHNSEWKKVISTEVYQAIMELNYNIHKLEPILIGEEETNYWVVVPKDNLKIQRELTPTEKLNFSFEAMSKAMSLAKSNNLGFIDYTTIGKNLHNCWFDGDIEIVKKGLIRNKTTSSPFIQYFFGLNIDEYLQLRERISNKYEIRQWLLSNSIQNIESILSTENINQFYPPILEMTEETERLYSTAKIHKLAKSLTLTECTVTKI